MSAPETYMDQPVPDDIAKNWHRWEGAAWRQNRYRQANNEVHAPSELSTVHPPEGMCTGHESQWRRWQERPFAPTWEGSFLAEFFHDESREHLHRKTWDDTGRRQMNLIETVCAQHRGCSTAPLAAPAPRKGIRIRGTKPLRVCMLDCCGPRCWCGRSAKMPSAYRRYFPGSTPSKAEFAAETITVLRTAVPRCLADIADEQPAPAVLYRRLDHVAAMTGPHGEGLAGFQPKTPKSRRRLDQTLNALAYGLALASLAPGGIHCYGVHWETSGAATNPLEGA